MHTRVEVRAARVGGRTALVVMRGEGALAVRATGPADPVAGWAGGTRVHLIGTAAGPMGGDVVEIDVRVDAGAHLCLRGVAATLALPHRDGGTARVELRVSVAQGARADIALEPVVVVSGAVLHALTRVDVAQGGSLDLTEQVVLGRWGEGPGAWRGSVHADLEGDPWLRQSIALGPGAPAWDALAAPRALLSQLRTQPLDGVRAATVGDAALMPLARGGMLLEAYGPDLAAARADAALAERAGTWDPQVTARRSPVSASASSPARRSPAA